jgi:predicted N-acetyltransferase YhbS
MKVVTYRELESTDGLLPLLDHAFNWVFNQKEFEDLIKIDPRLKNGQVSFCAVENGRIIGHVGLADLATRTLHGNLEYVGGLFGVATLPGCTRRGVCTALMDKAHHYFKEKHYRFSFLSTSPALIAHDFYKKLGYIDLTEYPSAHKVFHGKKPKHSQKENVGFDPDKILRIYDEFSKDKTGFVVRDKAYVKMLRKAEGIKPKQCIISEKGYVIFREDKNGVWVRELVALNEKEMHSLVDRVEDRSRGAVYDRAVLNAKLLEVYESRGYMIQTRGWGVIMFKPLISSASLKQTYGDEFYLSRLDAI